MSAEKATARKALQSAHLKRIAAEVAEVEAVAQARQAGVTWDEIGEDTAMAGPNAHRKFSKLITETRVVTVRRDDEQA